MTRDMKLLVYTHGIEEGVEMYRFRDFMRFSIVSLNASHGET